MGKNTTVQAAGWWNSVSARARRWAVGGGCRWSNCTLVRELVLRGGRVLCFFSRWQESQDFFPRVREIRRKTRGEGVVGGQLSPVGALTSLAAARADARILRPRHPCLGSDLRHVGSYSFPILHH